MSVWKQFGGGYRENAGAGADVKKAAAGIVLLNRVETETSCLVSSGAERHARLDAYDQTIGALVHVGPRRRDDETTNLDWLPTLFPFFQPVALRNCAHIHVTH